LSGHFLEDWFRATTFLLSSQTPAQLPRDDGREVAFAGRSNAGKSSAINAITGQKGLARASNTPGRTRLLNFFTLDEQHRLVDLPGYGYAKVARAEKERWQETLAYYLEERRSLAGLILVMDARHPLTEFDTQLLGWALTAALPVHVLLSKADKLGHGAAGAQLKTVQAALLARFPGGGVQLFSAVNRQGVDAARARIGEWLELPRTPPLRVPLANTRSLKKRRSAPPATHRERQVGSVAVGTTPGMEEVEPRREQRPRSQERSAYTPSLEMRRSGHPVLPRPTRKWEVSRQTGSRERPAYTPSLEMRRSGHPSPPAAYTPSLEIKKSPGNKQGERVRGPEKVPA